MDSIMQQGFTGFYFRPEFETIGGKDVEKGILIEWLRDGRVIKSRYYEPLSQRNLEDMQMHLLGITIFHQGLKEDLLEAILAARRTKAVDVVNMFKIEKIRENQDGTRDIRVIFIKSGYASMQSTFVSVSKYKLRKIRKFLKDNTRHNLVCETQCNSVTVLDLIAVIDNMLKNKR